MWSRDYIRPAVPTPEYEFEHSYDGYKLILGVLLWGSCVLLCIGTITELATTTPTDQALDETTFPTAIYLLLIGAVMIVQPALVFFQLMTIGADTPQHERTLAKISLFSWASNLAIGFIHFSLVDRSAFSFVIVVLYINVLNWLAYVYFQYEEHFSRSYARKKQ